MQINIEITDNIMIDTVYAMCTGSFEIQSCPSCTSSAGSDVHGHDIAQLGAESHVTTLEACGGVRAELRLTCVVDLGTHRLKSMFEY